MSASGLNRAAFERLFESEERGLYNVVLRRVWQADEAVELVQEAFVRLWDARARVDPATARAFVYRVGLNLATSKLRWRRVRQWARPESPAPPASPDDVVLADEQQARVRAAVDALPAALRKVLLLCELSELTHAEVAKVVGVKAGTVGSRRHAALALLRAELDAEGPHARA